MSFESSRLTRFCGSPMVVFSRSKVCRSLSSEARHTASMSLQFFLLMPNMSGFIVAMIFGARKVSAISALPGICS